MSWTVIHGDCLDVLKTLEAESVEACVTDPPYGLSFMGRDWDHGVPGERFWREVLRVLKPGAHLFAFGGTRTYHRLACAIEDAGFEVRDCLMWIYGSGFPKSLNLGNGWGTALKPAYEPILLARKPLAGTVAATVARYGTGAINIDGCRVGNDQRTYKGSGVSQQRYSDTRAGLTDGRGRALEFTAQGRWPANVLHDGSEEVVKAFPQSDHARGNRTPTKQGRTTWFGDSAGNDDGRIDPGDSGSAARFFYCAKASRSERERGLDAFDETRRTDGREKDIENPRLRTSARKNHHPTVKPLALMRYLVRLVTPPGGTVLDPFAGSGSTLVAAIEEGFDCLGIEREAEYVPIIEARCRAARRDEPKRSPTLFDEDDAA